MVDIPLSNLHIGAQFSPQICELNTIILFLSRVKK